MCAEGCTNISYLEPPKYLYSLCPHTHNHFSDKLWKASYNLNSCISDDGHGGPGNIYSIMTHLPMQPVKLILLYWLSCKMGHILYTLLGLSPLFIPIASRIQASPCPSPQLVWYAINIITLHKISPFLRM